MIRIHFFLLCALVHCLSSSVQCNQVNERACNEAIRCSLVLRARRSVLSWRTLAPGACAVASRHSGINSAPRLSPAALPPQALHTGPAGLPGLGVFQSSNILPRVQRRHETRRSGFGGIARRRLPATVASPSSSSPSPNLRLPLQPFLLWICLLHLCNMWKLLGGGGGGMC